MATLKTGRATARRKKQRHPPARRSRCEAAKTTERSADPLDAYRSKRDFQKTPEPSGGKRRRKKTAPIFVIQKHDATRLHYDFRLEIDGVLKSWAVPKGPSLNPADKRLAVETEDHPMDYADFEGVIPPDEYGGGTVLVWDAGTFRNLKHDARGNQVPLDECYERGQIEVWLEGEKLRGGYALVHTRMGGAKKNWLCIKIKDEGADPSRDPVRTRPRSVVSGRTLEEVASGKNPRRKRRSVEPARRTKAR